MKKFVLLLLIVPFVFSIGYSTYCSSIESFVTNLTYAFNNDKINSNTVLTSLNETSPSYYNCTSKHILVIEGDMSYSYKVDGVDEGTFIKHIFLLGGGTHNITAYKEGYITKTKQVTLSNFTLVEFSLEKNQSKSESSSSSSGGGPTPNVFYKLDKDSILGYMNLVASDIGLNNSEIEYQKKVYSHVPFEVKYVRISVGNANSIYYYFKNDWNQTVNVTLIAVIPKSVSQNLTGVAIVSGYKVIKSDPIIEWNKQIAPNQQVSVGYTVMKNVTEVKPLIVLFSGITVPEEVTTSQNVTESTSENITTTQQNITQSNATSTTNKNNSLQVVPSSQIDLKPYILPIVIGVTVGVGIIAGIMFFRNRNHYDELEEALNSLDNLFKTRRRK